MPKLLIKTGSAAGREFDFDGDTVVGRGSMTDIVIIDATISRRHAMIAWSDNQYVVTDLQSGNGTRVNGVRIEEPTALHDGDEVQFGSVQTELAWTEGKIVGTESKPSVMLKEDDQKTGGHVVGRIDARDPVASLVVKPGDMDALMAMSKRLQLIYDVGRVISSTLDEGELLELIMEKLFDVFPQAERGFIMLYDAEENQLLPEVARTRSGEPTEIAVSRTLIREVIQKRQGVLCADAMDDERYSMGVSIANFQIRSVIVVPMIAEGKVMGIVHVDGSESSKPFEEDDMALLLGIASQAALSLANSRMHQKLLKQELLEQDLMLANRIQLKFLPQSPPEVPGYDFQDDYSAALEVGGDYYDFFELPNGEIGIALGDVSGKGVSAALYTAKLSSDVRFQSASRTEPAEIMNGINASLIADVEEGMFVTLVYLSLNPETGEVKYSNAGHLRPLLRKANGEVLSLEGAADVPLGIDEETEFIQDSFQLEPGDTVVIFTDGVVEATDPDQEQFGDERVLEVLSASSGTPAAVKETILSAVKEFFRGAPPNDDLTLVCFGPVADESEGESKA